MKWQQQSCRMNHVLRALLLTLVALVGLSSASCSALYQEKFVEPRYDVRDAKLLVLRFREDRLWYGDSMLGNDFHRSLMLKLQECEDSELLANPQVEDGIYECLDDPPPWQNFAEAAGADFIVMGTIHDIGYREEGMIGMLKGRLSMTVEVYSAENKRSWRQRVDVAYPNDPETGKIEVAFEQNRQRLRAKMFKMAADRVGAFLCGELVDKRTGKPAPRS